MKSFSQIKILFVSSQKWQNSRTGTPFYWEGDRVLEHVTQKSCGISIHGDNQKPSWHDLGAPASTWAWTRWPGAAPFNLNHPVILWQSVHLWYDISITTSDWSSISQKKSNLRRLGVFTFCNRGHLNTKSHLRHWRFCPMWNKSKTKSAVFCAPWQSGNVFHSEVLLIL